VPARHRPPGPRAGLCQAPVPWSTAHHDHTATTHARAGTSVPAGGLVEPASPLAAVEGWCTPHARTTHGAEGPRTPHRPRKRARSLVVPRTALVRIPAPGELGMAGVGARPSLRRLPFASPGREDRHRLPAATSGKRDRCWGRGTSSWLDQSDMNQRVGKDPSAATGSGCTPIRFS